MQGRTMPLLEVCGLTKAFGSLVALGGIDLTIGENAFHGLIGPNGSGRSTLMNGVAGAGSPTAGTVRFGGRDIPAAAPAKRARAGLALKFQVTSVFPDLTVYDNVLLALQARSAMTSLIFS